MIKFQLENRTETYQLNSPVVPQKEANDIRKNKARPVAFGMTV